MLWSRGDWSVLRSPIVSVVGTRRATSYGLRVTREIVSALARAGATIVSGMALGIDAAAHRQALDANGRTVAVLGTGTDVAYPRAHVSLHREIGEKGLVLSELPPGAKSDAGSFPRRNRIIAALASLTIVAEAPVRSGALITAANALDLGRDVGCIPGPIDSPQSVGSNELIRDGAHAITSAVDALRLVGLEAPVRKSPELVDETEAKVWSALEHWRATSLDELCSRRAPGGSVSVGGHARSSCVESSSARSQARFDGADVARDPYLSWCVLATSTFTFHSAPAAARTAISPSPCAA